MQDMASRETRFRNTPTRYKKLVVHAGGPGNGADTRLEPLPEARESPGIPHMLMSPPPEDTLRTVRGKHASETRSSYLQTSATSPYSPMVKRKRSRYSSLSGGVGRYLGDNDELPIASGSQLTIDTTPNPKARKQPRHVSFAVESSSPTKSAKKYRALSSHTERGSPNSPHASSPKVDYTPLDPSYIREHSLNRRRSTTPIPLYEPPAERFTPPREVIYTPVLSISKSSKRKSLPRSSVRKGNGQKLVLQIKKEPPEIDLSAPMPPASPTDDPLLLRGPPRSHKKSKRRSIETQTPIYSRETPPMSSSPLKTLSGNETRLMDTNFMALEYDTDDDDNDYNTVSAVFNFDPEVGEADDWSDDDRKSDFDQSGEYTGNFKAFLVPTKADPPSSCTQARQEAWGRPTSPFPDVLRHNPIPELPEWSSPQTGGVVRSSSPPMKLSGPLREAVPLLPDTPRDGLREPPSEALPPSSPITARQAGSTANIPSTYSWRQLIPFPSDDPQDEDGHAFEEGDTPSNHVVQDSDLPIAEYEDEIECPPDTPMTEVQDTPYARLLQDIPRSAKLPIPVERGDGQSVVLASEDAMDLDNVDPQVHTGGLASVPLEDDERGEEAQTPRPPQHDHQIFTEAQGSVTARVLPSKVLLPETTQITGGIPSPLNGMPIQAASASPNAGVSTSQDLQELFKDATPHQVFRSHQLLASEAQLTPEGIEEHEDAESVVRELSQEPDFHDDDEEVDPAVAGLPPPTQAMSEMVPQSSPGNPFRVYTPGRAGEGRSSMYSPGQSGATPVVSGSATEAHRGPPRPWPPTPAEASIDAVLPPLDVAPIGDEGTDCVPEDPNIVKITSADPRAAARAAAILKLHKYDLIDDAEPEPIEPLSARSRDSDALLKSVLMSARRKSLSQAGVQKLTSAQRRQYVGGVIGNKVAIPGSPAITLPELLKEAEASVRAEEDSIHSSLNPSDALTPSGIQAPNSSAMSIRSSKSKVQQTVRRLLGPREWKKDDWKFLDSCYTDERLVHTRSPEALAPAESVDLGNVVDRFVTAVGGRGAIEALGPSWSRNNLLKRARALQRKQGAGEIAPPTPSWRIRRDASSTFDMSLFMSPDVSQISRLSTSRPSDLRPSTARTPDTVYSSQQSPPARPSLDASSTSVNHTSGLPAESPASFTEHSQSQPRSYEKTNEETDSSAEHTVSQANEPTTPDRSLNAEADRSRVAPLLPGPATLSFVGRVKGLIFSYLPRAVHPAPPASAPTQSQLHKGLPLPPPEVLQKPRPPIRTPAPKLLAKPPNPKDLVQLHPVHSKPSMIPRPTQPQNARQLVNLHPAPTRPSSAASQPILTPCDRRASSSSVKDLVRNFESMEKMQMMERESFKQLELKRKKSIQEWAKAQGNSNAIGKPSWQP